MTIGITLILVYIMSANNQIYENCCGLKYKCILV
jgi:hypothetical protein